MFYNYIIMTCNVQALALDALPEGADAAKDMGIWYVQSILSLHFDTC